MGGTDNFNIFKMLGNFFLEIPNATLVPEPDGDSRSVGGQTEDMERHFILDRKHPFSDG